MSNPCNPPLEIIPYKIRNGTINVIRDDYLDAGTKQRGQAFFTSLLDRPCLCQLSQQGRYRGVATVAATSGYGQLATTVMARKAKLSAYVIVSYQVDDNYMTRRVRESGNASYIVVTRSNHQLHYLDPITGLEQSIDDGYPDDSESNHTVSIGSLERVLDHFIANHNGIDQDGGIYKMSMGLNDPDYVQALTDAISIQGSHLQPKRVWLTVGSGTILSALKRVWPNTEFMCVQVGRNIDSIKQSLGITTPTYKSRYKFAESVPDRELPPFPSLANYDAKAWSFIQRYGRSGDYFWNVAG